MIKFVCVCVCVCLCVSERKSACLSFSPSVSHSLFHSFDVVLSLSLSLFLSAVVLPLAQVRDHHCERTHKDDGCTHKSRVAPVCSLRAKSTHR